MLRLLFRLPFWGVALLALAVVALCEFSLYIERQEEAEKSVARGLPVPPVVDLSDFDRSSDIGLSNEVHVTGWIDAEHNYHLQKTKNGRPSEDGYMFVLFGAEDTQTTPVAKAAIVFETKEDSERFLGTPNHYIAQGGPQGLLLKINGRGESRTHLSDMAKDAMTQEGLLQADDFIFIEPFLDGRAAALAADEGAAKEVRQMFYGVAAILAAIAGFKWRSRPVRAPKRDEVYLQSAYPKDKGMLDGGDPSPQRAKPSQAYDAQSPLGRISSKEAATAPTIPDATVSATPVAGKRRRSIPSWAIGLGVVALVVFIYPPALPMLIPLIWIAVFLFIAKLVLGGIGKGVQGAAGLLSGKAGSAKVASDPFDRLR